MSLERLYTLDELKAYDTSTKAGKARLEQQRTNIPQMLSTAKISLSKNPRILCLVAGSCIEGLVIAEHYNGEVTCLDLQKSSLAKGLKEAKRKSSNHEQ